MNDLLFYIEQGLIAGHDVGFDKVDFITSYFQMGEKAQGELRETLAERLRILSVCEDGLRIDGSGSELQNELWLHQQKKSLRIFENGYAESEIIKYLSAMSDMCKEFTMQKSWQNYLLLSAKPVSIVSIYDVLDERQVKKYLKTYNPQKRQCYKNAYDLVQMFPQKFDYVEGMFQSVIPFEHAFNKVDDSTYVDVTFELVLGCKVGDCEHISQFELNQFELLKCASASGVYGGYMRDKFIERYNK